ncbi:hypothetical protein J5N97_002336 [Dioscorea zingiberensis]|uniref:Homeobox domain-containing protein n=1 Tax=Dioscorea zingiberensis TaxID=325984 RepID=A0A9D5D4L0_9LILI|nr:hypothetical protein J5N97_002336 [Dioscorea zingiberensis]
MEDQEKGNNGSSSSSSSSPRWNPTKEQIGILEGLYRQGIRTPTAEQIQQITARLRQYGCIEGKNVFYWFQNHKARQRQKERQETFAYFTSLVHHPPPPPGKVFSSFCNPVYLQAPQVGGIGFYQQPQYQNSFYTSTLRMGMNRERCKAVHNGNHCNHEAINGSTSHQTLELFPLHPTGILEEKSGSSLTSVESESLEEGEEEMGDENMPIYNFFSSNSQRLC